MNISLRLHGRFNLNDKIDIRYVETARGHISSDQDIEFALLEPLESDLTLILSDVTVHDLDILLNLVSENQRVSISLGLGKDDRLTSGTSIDD